MAAPLGNQNARKAKKWADAVNRAVDAWPDRVVTALECNKGIDNVAHSFVSAMMRTEDISFYREFGDRLDGKAAQAIIGDADADPIQVQNIAIKLVPSNGA